MKTLSTSLAAHLASGATTLCRCWRIERRDRAIQGFTDHDRDLVIDSVTYRAATGLSASRADSALGLSVDDMSVIGVLSDDSLDENALSQGLYDEASVTLMLVNWQDVSQRTILKACLVGEVTRSEKSFTAELRGLSAKLDQPQGRRYMFGCDADLGDARCGFDLANPLFNGTGAVASVIEEARVFVASGLGAFTGEWFTRGKLSWTSGANDGFAVEIKRHSLAAGVHQIEAWLPAPQPIAIGDAFAVTAGCDKQFATCQSKFNNAARFRGFPYMPGNDFAISYPGATDVMDGGSRYK
ncbi:MAG: DUF2163 domain-containing protein [Alphaproteobacteria bacterium]